MFISKRMMNNCLKRITNFTLPRHRKTEPMLLWWTKIFVSIILLNGLIVYIVVLVNLIIKDKPSIQYSTNKLDSQQPFPSFNITLLDSNVTIGCSFHGIDNTTNCSASLELFNNLDYTLYKFTPTENIIGDGSNSGFLELFWNITGNNFDFITFGGELDDIKNNHPDQTDLQKYILYLRSDIKILEENMFNTFYIKWTRREYLIRGWTNYLGFPNHYISLRIAEPIALIPTANNQNQTSISILPYGFFTENGRFETVETEKRNETVLSNIGSLGGAISLLLGLYAILFGGSLLNPWGIFQNCCCKYKSRSKRKLLNNLPMIPLTEKTPLHYERSKDPDISEIKGELTFLITRFHSLETILREYVINSDFLDELETGKNKTGIDESKKPLM